MIFEILLLFIIESFYIIPSFRSWMFVFLRRHYTKPVPLQLLHSISPRYSPCSVSTSLCQPFRQYLHFGRHTSSKSVGINSTTVLPSTDFTTALNKSPSLICFAVSP